MWIIIGIAIAITIVALVLRVRHGIIMDTIADFPESGTYAYCKHGLWHLGVSRGK